MAAQPAAEQDSHDRSMVAQMDQNRTPPFEKHKLRLPCSSLLRDRQKQRKRTKRAR